MPKKEKLFLTVEDALIATRSAFNQYPFSLNLLSNIWPLVFGRDAYVQKDSDSRSMWIKTPGCKKLILSNREDIKDRILYRLQEFIPGSEKMAEISTLVFGTRVVAGLGPPPGTSPGIWIDTDMAGFKCIRCGHCCRTLNYKDGCTVSDYERWQQSGRDDILEWVGVVRENGRVVACQIWMEPGTIEFARTCPWLKKVPDRNQYRCAIHDVRPAVCRQYPGSRKHARLTGCKGSFKGTL